MQFRFAIAALAAAFATLVASPAQSASPMSSSSMMMGAGPHGYDFLIGTWSCKNTMPSAMGGPATLTLTVARAGNTALSFHASGSGFAAQGYIVYSAKTKTWWSPVAGIDGGYGAESTTQTGKKVVWAGPYMPPSGKTVQQRDTYTMISPTSYTDLYQVEMNGTWKTEGDSTCTKM